MTDTTTTQAGYVTRRTDTVNFILLHASEQDLDRVYAACKDRRRTLRDARAATVRVGSTVTLDEISPKSLVGLTGTVEAVRGKRADVRLDEASTTRLRRSRPSSRLRVPADATTFLVVGVPLGCCIAA